MTEYHGLNRKFIVQRWNPDSYKLESIDHYIKVSFVEHTYADDFPHLDIGEICMVDLTVSSQSDDRHKDIEIMMQMVNGFILDGAHIDSAIKVIKYQKHNPVHVIFEGESRAYGSVHDFIGRYLEGL